MSFVDAALKMTERLWMNHLVSTSKKHPGLAVVFGWKFWHDQATNAPRACPKCHCTLNLPRNDPGWPDLFLVRGDTLFVIELKSDRGDLTDEQEAWLAAFRAVRRIRVAVWRPRQFDEIARLLR